MAKWINEANGMAKLSGVVFVLSLLYVYKKNQLASRSSMFTLILLSIFSIAISSLLFENVRKMNAKCSWSGTGDDLQASDCKKIVQDKSEKDFTIVMIIFFCLIILITMYKLAIGHKAQQNLFNRNRGTSVIKKIKSNSTYRAR